MPFYYRIRETSAQGKRTLRGLKRLRAQLSAEIPSRNLNDTLLLATWNIREFDSPAYGHRSAEAIQYIAEIISRFDLIAIQEVRGNLSAIERLRYRLGSWWDYIVSDVTAGRRGNDERMAFLYDTRKIHFGRVAGELVLPPVRNADGEPVPVNQVARTPFMCGFSCGWSRFILATVHVLYGDSSADSADRVEEIRQIAAFIKARAEDPAAWTENFVLLGDFNIFKPGDATFQALLDNRFLIPEQLQSLPSNAVGNRFYDQIAFTEHGRFDFTGKAGVFDYYRSVYRVDDEADYAEVMGNRYRTQADGDPRTERGRKRYYRSFWRTHEMSDHLPMWVEIAANYSDEYLAEKMARAGID